MTAGAGVRVLVGTYVLWNAAILVLRWLNGVDDRFAGDLVLLSVFAVSHVVGALIALRRPRNPVGWLLLVSPYLVIIAFFADQYARYGLITAPGSLPAPHLVYWLNSWPWIGMFAGVLFAALFFPDGRLPSERWRPFAWVAAGFVILTATTLAFAPSIDPLHPALVNPFAVDALAGLALLLESPFGFFIFLVLLSGTVLSLLLRFRRSRGAERQQLKWVASAVAVAVVGFLLGDFLPDDAILADIAFATALSALPLAIGVAMLRYRLYDIDVLINRTLVYGGLSAILLGTYVVLVLALGAVLRPFTGSGDLTVAASTLAVVALFQPLRRCVQAFVDRRFYRSRYDAARTVDAFAARLRDQVELEAVRADLLGVVGETVRPAHVSLWLRR